MPKLTLTFFAAALVIADAGVALANHHGGPGKHNLDADGDGAVTLAEMTAMGDQMFTRIDANGDGVIDESDRAARQERRAEHRKARFASMDKDGDGELSQEEMKAAHEARMDDRAEQRAARAETMFARMDVDKSGGLSAEELEARRETSKGKYGKRGGGKRDRHGGPMHLLKRADTDGDGAITRAEFDAGIKAHFAKVDTDNSGTITADERKAAHAAMRAKRMGGQ